MTRLSQPIVLVRGAGEIASGVAHRLHNCRFRVCLTETDSPRAVCRGVAFSEAVFDGLKTIEGVTAELTVTSLEDIGRVWDRGNIPLLVDTGLSILEKLKPDVLVHAIMVKQNSGISINHAPLVIGLGTGFYAGRDVHIVIETNHSGNLGQLILEGEAEPNTGIPLAIGGLAKERVVWAEEPGIFSSQYDIGDGVNASQVVGWINDRPVMAPLKGILRGLIRSGVRVARGDKLIEIDPVNDRAVCYLIRDKVRLIAEGVLEAIRSKQDSRLHGVGTAC